MSNKQDILNELKVLSPLLFNLKENEKSIVVPNNYFEELVDIIISQTKDENGILSTLKKEKQQVPFGYFETFGESVFSKIKTEEQEISQGKIVVLPKSQNKILQLFSRIAIAASIIGAMFFVKQLLQPKLPLNDCTDGIACLTQDEIYNYMNVNSHDFDIQEIQETVEPIIENSETKIDIDKKEATQYFEENKIILESDDASTDIF